MHNQRLPFRWEVLSLFEVSCFIDAVFQLASGSSQYLANNRNESIDPRELAAFAATMFLRSIPPEDVLTLKLNAAAYAQIEPPGCRYYKNKTGCWVVLPPKLPLKMKLGKDFYSSAELRREFYFVRSGTGLEGIVDRYIGTVRGSVKGGQLFLHPTALYQSELQRVIASINTQHNTRLTLKRIEAFLHNYLAKAEGADLTTAMLLTGRDDFLGMPPLHYTAIPVKHLQRMYFTSCRTLMLGVERELAAQGRLPAPDAANGDTHAPGAWYGMAGTCYRPKRKAVRRMVLRLQERMAHIQGMPKSIRKVVLMHNNIMRYTAILFAFSTGFRAVRSPLLPPSQIVEATGFAVISDKDGIDYYNARIVWLPPVCMQQYRTYLEHLDCLLPKLEYFDIKAFNSLRYLLGNPYPTDKIPLFFF